VTHGLHMGELVVARRALASEVPPPKHPAKSVQLPQQDMTGCHPSTLLPQYRPAPSPSRILHPPSPLAIGQWSACQSTAASPPLPQLATPVSSCIPFPKAPPSPSPTAHFRCSHFVKAQLPPPPPPHLQPLLCGQLIRAQLGPHPILQHLCSCPRQAAQPCRLQLGQVGM
jgi:hypothetical protein